MEIKPENPEPGVASYMAVVVLLLGSIAFSNCGTCIGTLYHAFQSEKLLQEMDRDMSRQADEILEIRKILQDADAGDHGEEDGD